ncbi:NAD(P)-binding protein [Streptomyces sp. NPDC093225]|uniref:NAD(P)-binding protein n=1 Tax=Streptomyces sp. NPDC093225 TaxID=3366034 RepID=UPI0038281B15
MQQLTVIGGGFAGLTAAVSAAEAGARVTLYEAHRTLGGRARTARGPYRVNEGPHAFYRCGPHWSWLTARGLTGPLAPVPLRDAAALRLHHGGRLRTLPPRALLRLALRPVADAPVDRDFHSWAAGLVGADGARAVANLLAVALFHHDVGSLSAAFVQERLRRVAKLPPEAVFPRGGWQSVTDRMADRARSLGVRIETGARIDALPAGGGPVVVATSLAAARTLLGDPALTWQSGRTVLLDLALRERRGDPYAISDLDAPGWFERFTAQDRSLAPAGQSLVQAQLPIAPGQHRAVAVARAERVLDLGFPGWRDRSVWRREAVADGRTGALDLPGTTWRDRPAIDRGDGVYLAGDQVSAPGVLSEVSFNSAIEAVALAMRATARPHARTRTTGTTGTTGTAGTTITKTTGA